MDMTNSYPDTSRQPNLDRSAEAANDVARNPASVMKLFEAVCQDSAEVVNASRSGVWQFNSSGDLVCRRRFDRQTGLFVEGPRFPKQEKSGFLAALRQDQLLVAQSALRNPAFADLLGDYLEPFGIKSLLVVALRKSDGEVVGALILEAVAERREWNEHDLLVVCELAELLGRVDFSGAR